MTLTGDPEGLQALKELGKEQKDTVKFLITEAKTSADRTADFAGLDGRKWKLRYNPASDELAVESR